MKKRNFVKILLSVFLALYLFGSGLLVNAAQPDEAVKPQAVLSQSSIGSPSVSASAAVLMEAVTGRVLYGKGEDDRLPMASTTKIMTALLTLEQSGLDTPFTVDPKAIMVEGTSMGLTEGSVVSLRSLASGMLLASGNDAANAAAVRIAGSIPEFVMMMNRRAAQLGLTNTNYETPSGLDGQSHYSTAKDMALLARAALQNEDFRSICSKSSMKLSYGNPPSDRWLSNHNRLLKEYEGCIGLKTGFTKKAGRCLVSAAERNGVTLISVTLHDPDDWRDHKNLLDYGFSKVVPIPEQVEQLSVPVTGGAEGSVIVSAGSSPEVCAFSDELTRITKTVNVSSFLYAPVVAGEQVGEVRYYLDGEVYYTVPLTTQQSVDALEPPPKQGFWGKLKNWWNGMFSK